MHSTSFLSTNCGIANGNTYQRSKDEDETERKLVEYSSDLSLITLNCLFCIQCSCLCGTFYKELNKHC